MGVARHHPGDPFDLERFLAAQEGVYDHAEKELRGGRKTSHWMWFIFPQIGGLGRSDTARFYAISSSAEARAYLAHPVLGPRLETVARILADELMQQSSPPDAVAILGATDARKLRSSMTLFHLASGSEQTPYRRVLDRYFDGELDPATVGRLR